MAHRVCPPILGYLLACPIRRLIHRPERILAPFVRPAATVLDIGPAMGFFTLPLARMVGPQGRVLCVDVQPEMLEALKRRATSAGLADRLVLHACPANTLDLGDFAECVDFALAFAVVHEVGDAARLFADAAAALKPGACLLVAEPKGHVPAADFAAMVRLAQANGLDASPGDAIPWCHVALFRKPGVGPDPDGQGAMP